MRPTLKQHALAIFDLDNTLLKGDSDHAWGEFLIQQGLVDAAAHRRQNDAFYTAYANGTLDIQAYLNFALQPIAGQSPDELAELREKFMRQMIEPMRLPKADALLNRHRERGDDLLIITATNDFITRPIASWLGVEELLACEAEIVDGRYTGKPVGTPCFQGGKVIRLREWMQNKPYKLADAIFYSDSHNDLPLLEAVGRAVAVDADSVLQEQADARGWESMTLRG